MNGDNEYDEKDSGMEPQQNHEMKDPENGATPTEPPLVNTPISPPPPSPTTLGNDTPTPTTPYLTSRLCPQPWPNKKRNKYHFGAHTPAGTTTKRRPQPGQTKDATNTTTAHAPRLAPLRNDDPLLGQSYPLPPRFFLLKIRAPRPGQTYATVNAKNTPPSPSHLPHVPHPGPSYRTASIQPHKTAEMPNGESRLSPGVFRINFLFDFIYSLTITHNNNTDLCSLLYPVTSPYLHHHTPSASLLFSGPVVCGHTQKRT